MAEWETISENTYNGMHCILQRIEVYEGYIYRHMTSDGPHPNESVTMIFVEKKKE